MHYKSNQVAYKIRLTIASQQVTWAENVDATLIHRRRARRLAIKPVARRTCDRQHDAEGDAFVEPRVVTARPLELFLHVGDGGHLDARSAALRQVLLPVEDVDQPVIVARDVTHQLKLSTG